MISLDELKKALRVSNSLEDDELQRRLDSAVAECTRYLNAKECPESADVINGIVLVVQADFEGDPLERQTFRAAAMELWNPYRLSIGI